MATIIILGPGQGASVFQPFPVMGTVSPSTDAVKASALASDGKTYNGNPASATGPSWSFAFSGLPGGAATITVCLTDGSSPTPVDITIRTGP